MCKCDFTYSHYKEMLKRALDMGYVISNFENLDMNKNKMNENRVE